jgi:hypothetical protein
MEAKFEKVSVERVRVPFDPLGTGCGLDVTQAEQAATGF